MLRKIEGASIRVTFPIHAPTQETLDDELTDSW